MKGRKERRKEGRKELIGRMDGIGRKDRRKEGG
jgi:hypothetical protein